MMSLDGVLKRLTLGVSGRSVHIAANRLASLEEKVILSKNTLSEIIHV